MKRMAITDRALLLIGSYELNFCPSVSRKETITSIGELAIEYGGETTSEAFLSRILSRLPERRAVILEQAGDTPPTP